jgi:hypothetical protein
MSIFIEIFYLYLLNKDKDKISDKKRKSLVNEINKIFSKI